MAIATEQQQATQASTTDGSLDAVIQQTERERASITQLCAAKLGVASNKVCHLLRQVWKTSKGQAELTDADMFTGMSLIARYELDPIAKEIYVTRGSDGRVFVIVAIDGWIKILDRNPDYDGFEQEFGYGPDGLVVIWIETRIFHKHRSHPTVYRGYRAEYEAMAGFVAKKMPLHMLGIFSLRHAARRFASIGGNVVLQEDFDAMEQPAQQEPSKATSRPTRKVKASTVTSPHAAPTAADVDHDASLTGCDESYGVPDWAMGKGFGYALLEADSREAVEEVVKQFCADIGGDEMADGQLAECGLRRIAELTGKD